MFKKFLAYLLIISLLLPALPVQAEGIYKMVGSGAVTQANMRISAVNGTAFIDFSDSEAAANKLINHKGYLLKVRDSSKRAIQGYVKAAGTGETLGVEEIDDNGDFAAQGSWLLQHASITVSGGKGRFTATPSSQSLYQAGAISNCAGKLYKFVWTIDSVSGLIYPQISNYFNSASVHSSANTYNDYLTTGAHVNGNINIVCSGASTTAVVDDVSVKQVLTPSATGVTITSTKGGSTFNFAALDSAFNYTDASGYTYELWQVNNAVEVASGSIAAGEMLADTTATNAFVAPVGVDLSAYQTGKYIFAAYNTVGGYGAYGYIKGTAPGGETLDVEKNTTTGATSDPNSNETDANGSWAAYGGGSPTIDSVDTGTPAVGTYHLLITSGTSGTGAKAQLATTAQGLYKASYQSKVGTANNIGFIVWSVDYSSIIMPALINYSSSYAAATERYGTATNTGMQLIFTVAADSKTAYIDNFSFKQVTDCAATGALIVSAKDGATRAWTYKHASFDPNLASTYKIFYTGD